MAGHDSDPLEPVLRRLSEGYQRIRLGRGIVGKTSNATLALFFLWAIILYRLSGTWLDAGLVAAGIVVSGIYVWWTKKVHAFAERHPGAALLEGAEFIEYQKWEAEVKGHPKLGTPKVPNPHLLSKE